MLDRIKPKFLKPADLCYSHDNAFDGYIVLEEAFKLVLA